MKTDMGGKLLSLGRVALLMGVVGAISGASSAWAQTANSARGQIAALQQQVAQLRQMVNVQTQSIAQLQQQTRILQALLSCMSKTGNEVFFTGCNVHVVSGAGSTYAIPNGLGNLIVGYNEDAAFFGRNIASIRTGSHNLVVGPGHSYSSSGGLVAGVQNQVTELSASVTGGVGNSANGFASSVTGGLNSVAGGTYATVSGGSTNTASFLASSVSGGISNTASGAYSTVSGGGSRKALGQYHWAAGSLLQSE